MYCYFNIKFADEYEIYWWMQNLLMNTKFADEYKICWGIQNFADEYKICWWNCWLIFHIVANFYHLSDCFNNAFQKIFEQYMIIN